jgi:hypothetical protein
LGIVHAEVAASVLGKDAGLDEGAWVEKGVEALAGRELVAGVLLAGDASGASAGQGGGARAGDGVGDGVAGVAAFALWVGRGVGRGGLGRVEEAL